MRSTVIVTPPASGRSPQWPLNSPTLLGWFPVTALMAAVMSFAVPSIACATGLEGSDSWAAIWLRDRPWSTWGEKLAPMIT